MKWGKQKKKLFWWENIGYAGSIHTMIILSANIQYIDSGYIYRLNTFKDEIPFAIFRQNHFYVHSVCSMRERKSTNCEVEDGKSFKNENYALYHTKKLSVEKKFFYSEHIKSTARQHIQMHDTLTYSWLSWLSLMLKNVNILIK